MCCLLAIATVSRATPSEHVATVDLRLSGLEYDPFTQKLYGTDQQSDRLLQIDPVDGRVLASFEVGNNPSKIERASDRALWIGLDGMGAVRRFNLETLTPGEVIAIEPGSSVVDLATSSAEPYSLAVTTMSPDGTKTTRGIRNGQLLEGSAPMHFVTMEGNSIYGMRPGNENGTGIGYKMQLGSNGQLAGIATGWLAVPPSDLVAVDQILYHPKGRSFRAADWNNVNREEVWSSDPDADDEDYQVVFNKERNHFFYLKDLRYLRVYQRTPGWHLRGMMDLGIADDREPAKDVQAWANRLAFYTAERLYLADTTPVYAPADLEISQAIYEPVNFGEDATVWLTLTNKGPGVASDVVLTNFIGANMIVRATGGFWWGGFDDPRTITHRIFSMVPGEEFRLWVRFTPEVPGTFTNQAAAGSSNDPNAENDRSLLAFPVVPPEPGLLRLRTGFADAGFTSGQVIGFGSSTDRQIWRIDPDRLRFSRDENGFRTGHQMEIDADGLMYILGDNWSWTNTIVSIRDTYYDTGAVLDFAISKDGLAVVSGTERTLLYRARPLSGGFYGARLPEGVAGGGYIDFSADGTKVYRIDPESCEFSVLQVRTNGLSLQSTTPNVSCTRFETKDGILYFQDGLILDAEKGTRITNAPSFAPPVLFVPREGGGFDALNRTGGAWRVERFRPEAGGGLERFASREIGEISGVVLEAFAAGENRLAYRSTSELGIADLPVEPDLIRARLVRTGPGEVAVQFPVSPGTKYQVETTDGSDWTNWRPAGDPVVGENSFVTQRFPTTNSAAFYRVIGTPGN